MRLWKVSLLVTLTLLSCMHLKVSGINFAPEHRFSYNKTEYLNYRLVGEGKRKVIFLHGFGASSRTWDDVIQLLSLNDSQLILIDLIGSGFSSKPRAADYSMLANAIAIAKFVEENGFEDYIFVGHSFGGGVALISTIELLENYEHHPTALILVDAAAYKTELPFFVDNLRIPIVNSILLSLTSTEFQARYTLEKIYYDKNKVTSDKVARYAFFMSMEGHDNAMIQTAKQIIPKGFQRYVDRYKTLNMPVLILWGRQDPAISLEYGRRLKKDIPRASLSIIEESGHNPQEEQPEEIANEIYSFIKELDAH